MKIFITMPQCGQTRSFITPRALEKLMELGEVAQNPYDRDLSVDELLEMAQDADILLTGWGTAFLEKRNVAQFKNLRLIAHTGGTVGNLLAPDVYELGIPVISGNDVYAQSVAEGCLCYILCGLRRIEHYSRVMREGGWKEVEFQNRGLIGKKIGIVGFGTISKHFLQLIRWFRCEVLIYSSHLSNEEAEAYDGRTATLEEIFSTCEVISIHTSLNQKTHGLVSRELMEKLMPNALLVNTSRGGVIDETALFELLMDERFYAVLDVYTEEPFPKDEPIRQCKNVMLIPHMGGPTMDMREEVTLALEKDIAHLLKGEALENEISFEAAKRMTKG